mmetsp:Transcript_51732/g.138461  ORF Transcript_51732/g.138461 Transcript_51732/m.138461 type:complete len:206 (-) Transcript_51732:24-641(-)
MIRPDTGSRTKPPQHRKLPLLAEAEQSSSPPLFNSNQRIIWKTPSTKPITAATCWMKTNSRFPMSLNISTRSVLLSTSTSTAICLMSMMRWMLAFRSWMTGPNIIWLSSRVFVCSSTFTYSGSLSQSSGKCLCASLASTAALVCPRTVCKLWKKSSGLMRSMISSMVIRLPIMRSQDRSARMLARLGTMPCHPRTGLQQPTNSTG